MPVRAPEVVKELGMRGEMRHVLFAGVAEIDDSGFVKAVEQTGHVHRAFPPTWSYRSLTANDGVLGVGEEGRERFAGMSAG
jgi:hypothetical protein